MKKLLFLFALSLSTYTCIAQKTTVPDSVHKIKMDSMAILAGRYINTNLDSIEKIADYMLSYSKKHNFLRGQAQALGTLAAVYNSQGYNGKSLLYHKKALAIFKELGNDILASRTRVSISILFDEVNEYELALAYAKEAQAYYIKINYLKDLARTYQIIGNVYHKSNKPFDSVMFQLKKAEETSRSFIKDSSNKKTDINNNIYELCGILNSQSLVYIERKKDVTLAIDRAKQAIEIQKSTDSENHYTSGFSYMLLSRAYGKKKEFKKALAYNDSALTAYKILNYPLGLKETYESRKNILAGLGDFKKAFEAAGFLAVTTDSLNKEDTRKQFSRMRVEYETDRIAAEKATAEAKAKLAETTSMQNRNYFIGAILIAFLILLSSLFYFRKLKTTKQAEFVATELKQTQKRLLLEKKYKESELKALKSQMNPHFIFNALNSIQEYIITNKKDEASDYLGRFADLIRRYLRHSDARSIAIADEVESLKMYLDLEALRFEKEFKYHISLANALRKIIVHIPTMLVQPYVENAIRHGLLHKKGIRKLAVSFSLDKEDTVTCIVEDNGVGRKKGTALSKKNRGEHRSFADKATQERLELFNSSARKKVGIETIDLFEYGVPSGTKVILTIPIIT